MCFDASLSLSLYPSIFLVPPFYKHLPHFSETGESKWEKPTDTNPNAKISPDQKRVLESPDTMAQLQESVNVVADAQTCYH